jgi:hypothetical protein
MVVWMKSVLVLMVRTDQRSDVLPMMTICRQHNTLSILDSTVTENVHVSALYEVVWHAVSVLVVQNKSTVQYVHSAVHSSREIPLRCCASAVVNC